MSVSDLMAAMMDAGASPEVILMAVRAVEAEQIKAAEQFAEVERRRTIERERKRRQRDKDRDEAVNVTGQSRDSHGDIPGTVTDAPPSLPPNDNISNPPALTPTEHKTRARKGTRLPVDWSPSPFTGQIAIDSANWSPGAIERELSKFRDWAASAPGERGVKSDWDAAWRNWLRRASDDGHLGRNNGPASSSRTGGGTIRDAAADVYAELAAGGHIRSGSTGQPALNGGSSGGIRALPSPDRPVRHEPGGAQGMAPYRAA